MTYFDFMDFEPVRFISSNTTKRKILSHGPTLNESPMRLEAPGFTKKDVTAEIKDGKLLHIKAESNKYGERGFEQVMMISDKVDLKTIELTVEDGMITIEFKHKEKESLSIKVK